MFKDEGKFPLFGGKGPNLLFPLPKTPFGEPFPESTKPLAKKSLKKRSKKKHKKKDWGFFWVF